MPDDIVSPSVTENSLSYWLLLILFVELVIRQKKLRICCVQNCIQGVVLYLYMSGRLTLQHTDMQAFQPSEQQKACVACFSRNSSFVKQLLPVLPYILLMLKWQILMVQSSKDYVKCQPKNGNKQQCSFFLRQIMANGSPKIEINSNVFHFWLYGKLK